METKTVSYVVDKSFVNPSIFSKASPEETTILLTVAGKFHELFLNEYKNTSEKVTDAHKQGIDYTIQKILEEAKKSEKQTVREDMDAITSKNKELETKLYETKTLLNSKTLELEFTKTHNLDRKEAERLGYEHGYEACKTQYIEEKKELVKESKETARINLETQKRMTELQDAMLKLEQTKNECITKLKDENAKLNTPMGKGESGEYVVEETIRNAGFSVFDTSKTPYKEQGYMDRVITEDGNFPSSGWMIAIEIKNKKRISKSTDIEVFKTKSNTGIKNGLFHASIFFSIEVNLGKDNTEVGYVNDESGIPLGPMAFYSPFTSSSVLTQEQLVLCVIQHVNLMKQCMEFRTMIINNVAKNEDINRIQLFFKKYVNETRENFEEFSEMTKSVQKMTSLLEKKKKKMFEQFKDLEEVNSKTTWLNTNFAIPLNMTFENAKKKYETNQSATKSQVFSKIGNVPLLHNQLGLENAWAIIKTRTHHHSNECFDEDTFAKVNETVESLGNSKPEEIETEYVNSDVEDVTEHDSEEMQNVSNQIVEHIKRKRLTKTDFELSSVTMSTIATNVRDNVRKVGGLDLIKRYVLENKDKWPEMEDVLVDGPKPKKQKS